MPLPERIPDFSTIWKARERLKNAGVEEEIWSELQRQLDEKGYVVVDEEGRTSVKGVYAAGDITNRPLKQIITAAAQGAVAATTVYEELKEK